MNRPYFAILLVSITIISSCAAKREYILSKKLIQEPKTISIEARRLPWVLEIERRLRVSGFEINAKSSVGQRTIKQKNVQISFNEASTRYIVRIDGSADLGVMTRCMGGGYNFEYITVELYDTQKNKILRQYSSNGYSEGCQPLSGSIFTDITNLINNAWDKD